MRTAIIGLGPHGKRLVQVVNRIEELELVGVVDRRPEALASLAGFSESGRFGDTASLYEGIGTPDVLLIATNGPSHAALAIEAMERGVPYVMVEKPMACSVRECREIEQKARQYNVRLSVNKKNRLDPVFQYLKRQLETGRWGSLRHLSVQMPGIGLGCVGTHWFDMANFLAGRFPRRVVGWVDEPRGKNPRGDEFVDPGGLVVCEYEEGVRAVIAQIEDGAGPFTMEIHTTTARIIFDPKNRVLDIRERDLSVKPGPGRPPQYQKVEPPTDLNLAGDMLEQMEGVVRELISDRPMITDARYGTASIEILVAAYLSHQSGNVPIALPLQDPEHVELYLPVT